MIDASQDRTSAPDASLSAPEAGALPWSHVIFRRRRFLVHRRYQLRVTAITVGTVFVLLLLLNFLLFAANQRSTQAATQVAPELRPYFAAQDRFQIGLMALGSLAFLAGVFLLGILETHRTAGASFNACRCLDRVRDGEYRVRMRLRRGDNLKEIEQSFNDMADALHSKTLREAAVLEELAGKAEAISGPEASALAWELRNQAREKRLRVE